MTLLLAAVGATVTALLELTIGPYLRVGTAEPQLVLVIGIVVTVALNLEAGLVWAFVGGLVLDVLAQRPLGSSAFALLLSLGLACLLGHWFARLRQIVPIPAAFILGVLYSMTLLLAFNALAAPVLVSDPLGRVIPSAIYDVVIATLTGPLAISIHDRRTDLERVDW
ncbi:MAG: rod shape-determining protein MreD [Chloroflexi bacterium]|nr:rod shape-determining protein MreD [Chloroflexota bacterium]